MTREIKFRVWNKKEKKWMFGYDYPNLGGFSLLGEVVMMGELSSVPISELQNLEVMQYTGLKDKNGVEIYEGDIMKDENGVIFKIFWSDDFYLPGFAKEPIIPPNLSAIGIGENWEVIGNIYQNPELLTPQTKEE